MAGTLYVVATPIGNLEDVTLRALRILRDVSLIAAEDTRRTARLLQHYSISTPTTSLHEHNERRKSAGLVARLEAGDSIALVSDAGTPTISDPGEGLVATARAAGIRVESVPGPSAVMAALSASGLPTAEFTFLGFAPARSKDRKQWLAGIVGESRTVVFFEAPHRIHSTLTELGHLIDDRPIGIGRLVVGPIAKLLARFAVPKGEFTVIIPPGKPLIDQAVAVGDDAIEAEVGRLIENNDLSPRDAARQVARSLGLPTNEVYRRFQAAREFGRSAK
ncbi:MAG: 16S rRNA (cytidine(1402)-2'-O)-methyltransferase [Acidobacteria bacterium]|nr:MAG: 16S rRNA (cytidine(1402)-2'-O)-methyltransferase [Acidobacteriota bacterium]